MPEDDEKPERYLAANAKALDLVALAQKFRNDPGSGVRVVDIITGVDGSVILDLEMTPARAEQLKREMGPPLIVEPNAVLQPISLLDG